MTCKWQSWGMRNLMGKYKLKLSVQYEARQFLLGYRWSWKAFYISGSLYLPFCSINWRWRRGDWPKPSDAGDVFDDMAHDRKQGKRLTGKEISEAMR